MIGLSRIVLTASIEHGRFLWAFIIRAGFVWDRLVVLNPSGPIAYVTT